MSGKEASLEEKESSHKDSTLENLLSEIEELNKEALSKSVSNKTSSTNSTFSDNHSSLSKDLCYYDCENLIEIPDETCVVEPSVCDEVRNYNVEENINASSEIPPYSIRFPLSESWINTTIPNTKHISVKEQSKKKTPPCDAKVKVSIPLETYANTPLNTALNNKRPALTDVDITNSKNSSDSFEDFKTVTVDDNNYIVLSLLGRGGNSKVFSCLEMIGKQERAIKKVFSTSSSSINLLHEVSIMRELNDCKNVITFYGFEIRDKSLYIILERGYCNLSVIIKEYFKTNDKLPKYKLMYYWMEILNAVQEVHNRQIAHLDLKLSNFVQCRNGIKLIDFGTAIKVNENNFAIKYTQVGSANYVCPEAITNIASQICDNLNSNVEMFKVTLKSDIWSLGCILYELVYKKSPFYHIIKINDKLKAIIDPNHEIKYPHSAWASQKLVETMKICLVRNEQKRPSINELITFDY